MKKGFTLIELLAVIVILAIIALIATPIVLSIINDSKESAVIRSAEFYVDTVENKIMQENMKQGGTLSPEECTIGTDGNVTCDGTPLEIEVNGEKPSSGSITFDKGLVTNITLTFGDKKVSMNQKGELVLEDRVEQKLAPGLYDENDNLLISWEDLTSLEYKSFTHYNELDEEVISPILSVDKNGVLITAYDYGLYENLSADYLNGKLVLDDSVTSLEGSVFLDCSGLTSVTIPENVTSIESYTFAGCTSLKSITIPESVTSIGDNAFKDCASLASITVDKKNTVYDSRNESNAIIETETNTLIVGGKSTVIPDSVTHIGAAAFNGCTGLTSITIPSSVTSIGNWAFINCTGLLTINYRGTESNWNAISKGTNWDNNTPSNKVINYNYAE